MSAEEKAFLIVDEIEESRVLTQQYLRSFGFSKIYETSRISEALDVLNVNQIDCIIADWDIPGASAYTLLKLLRMQSKYENLVFILMSETDVFEIDRLLKAASLKVDGYLLKPFTAEALSKLLSERLVPLSDP